MLYESLNIYQEMKNVNKCFKTFVKPSKNENLFLKLMHLMS